MALANPGAAGAHLGGVAPEAIAEALPDLHILGGAMMEVGITQASEFVELVGALKLAVTGHPPDPAQAKALQGKFAGLFSQIQDGEQWAEARAKALQRRARLFANGLPAEALQVLHPQPVVPVAISDHPLGTIVETKDGGYRLFLWVETRPNRKNHIRGLIQDGKRLQISLRLPKNAEGAQINQTLRIFLTRKLGLDSPGQVEIVSGQTHPQRKSVVIHQLTIEETLNRLNQRGPRYISRHEREILARTFHSAQKMLIHLQLRGDQVQELAGQLEATDAQDTAPYIQEIRKGAERIRQTLATVESLLARPHLLTGAQARNIQTFLQEIVEVQGAVLNCAARFFVIPAVAQLKTANLMHNVEEIVDKLVANHQYFGESWSMEISKEVRQSHAEQQQTIHNRGEALRQTGRALLSDWRLPQTNTVESLLALQERAAAFLEGSGSFLESVGRWEQELASRETGADSRREGLPDLRPAESYPKAYRHLIAPLELLAGYVLVAKGSDLSPLDWHLAELTAGFNHLRREAVVAFDNDIEFWPGPLRNHYQPLLLLFEKMRTGIKETRRDFKTALESMGQGAHPGQVQNHIFLGLSRLKALFGTLRGDPDIWQRVRLPKKTDADLLARWKQQMERIWQVVREEKATPFSLNQDELRDMQEVREHKLGGWEQEGKAILAEAEGLKLSVSKEDWTDQMEYLYQTIRSAAVTIPENIKAFAEVYDDLKTELARASLLSNSVMRFYIRALNTKNRIRKSIRNSNRLLTGKVKGEKRDIPNLTDLIRHPPASPPRSYEVPDRTLKVLGMKITVEGGEAKIGPVSVPLLGSVATQDRKIRDVVATLAIPDGEKQLSLRLAYPPFREEVRKLLEADRPLRELLAVNDEFGVAVVLDHRFGTAFYIPYKTGWVLPDARSIVPMFHGGGGERSTGLSMVAPATKLRNDFSFNAIAFDAPNHGRSVQDKRFHNLTEFISWMGSIIDYFRYLSGGVIPVVAVGRSHGDNALDQYAVAHPGKLDGIIGFSGYDPAWEEATRPTEERRIAAGKYRPHPTGRPMVDAHDPQWTFLKPELDEPRRRTMTLFVSGTSDEEYAEGVPNFYLQRKARADRLGHKMLIVEGGGHDLLSLSLERIRTKPEEIGLVYEAIKGFVEEAIRQFIEQTGR